MYNSADGAIFQTLSDRFGTRLFLEGERYFTEPRGRYAGHGIVIAPRNSRELGEIMALCFERRVPVIPYGGGTGLVGGQIWDGGCPLVVSLERMNEVHRLDPVGNIAEVGAGCILDTLRDEAAKSNRLFPLALASGGSARLGGLLATNAGGVNVLRYGSARALCLGVEAVLPDGRIYHGLSDLRKDNTGYDLRDLLIGSEGTLGIITRASLRLVNRPSQQGAALLAVASPQKALDLLSLAHDQLGEGVSAFELISQQCFRFFAEANMPYRCPISGAPEWMVLIDLGLPQGMDVQAALETLFIEAGERGLSDDGVIASNETQRAALWAMREEIPIANRAIGAVSSHDISIPLPRIAEFIEEGAKMIARLSDGRINCFGHLGDGNLHYNLFPAPGKDRKAYDTQALQRAVHDLVVRYDGSVSAEHGIGRLKVADLERYGDPVKLQMMRSIKSALDPRSIMNPGVILRAGAATPEL